MKKIKSYVTLIICVIYVHSFGQNNDSLWKIYNNKNKADTIRLDAMDNLAWNYKGNNPDTAIVLAKQLLQLAINAKSKKYQANAFTTLGVCYKFLGNYPKAVDYYLKALKIMEQLKNNSGIASCNMNIGIVYSNLSNYTKAQSYLSKSLQVFLNLKDKKSIAVCYANIGTIYAKQSKHKEALKYFMKCLSLQLELKNKQGIGMSYGNIGNVYDVLGDNEKALFYHYKALELRRLINDKHGVAVCYNNIAESKLLNTTDAIKYADSALQISTSIFDIASQQLAYQTLAQNYAKINNYKQAYQNHVKFKQLTDSIFNENNSKQLGDLKTQFEVDKKETELKLKAQGEQDKLKAIANEEKKRQQIVITLVSFVLLLVVVFLFFLFNRFRITNRQKNIIQQQKTLVDKAYESLHEKNKEVMDSINYARRIQNALLPNEKYISKHLRN